MSKENKVDEKKLKNMIYSIIALEKKNVRTQELSNKEVISKIQKIIEEEAKCL